MPEFWLSFYPVGFDRGFVVGRVPENEDFEQELTPDQLKMYNAFMGVQQQQQDEFLMGLVL